MTTPPHPDDGAEPEVPGRRELTHAETLAIRRLKRALQSMPKTLSIFADGHAVRIYSENIDRLPEMGHGIKEKDLIVESIYASCTFDSGGF